MWSMWGVFRAGLGAHPQPNHGVLAPREARNLGSGCKSMQLVAVPQEVSTSGDKSSLMKASPAGQERTRVPPRQGPYGAGWSEETGRVMAPRKGESRGKPTVCTPWKAVVLDALWQGCRTPPGAASGAGL